MRVLLLITFEPFYAEKSLNGKVENTCICSHQCKTRKCSSYPTMHFIGRVTLFFANKSLTECRITIKILHIFLDPVIFSSHTMFINASTKEFTLIHLVTFCISRSRFRMKFYLVYRLIRL